MFVRREFDWLNRRFQKQEYDLVYLDPLVCSFTLPEPQFSPWIRRQEEKPTESFLGQLVKTLGVKSEDATPSSFMGDKGLGTKFKDDRILQRRVAHVINQHLNEVPTRRHSSVGFLQKKKPSLKKIANRPQAESLIIVDAMLCTRAGAPEQIQQLIQAPAQYLDNSMRGIECMLTDGPGPVLTLCDPLIGLMADENAFYNWTEAFNIILSAGWYPFARTVGLYATSPGGPPFINVIAILMRPYPPLYEVLTPPRGKPARWCLPGMLQYVMEQSLDSEIKRLQEKKKKKKPVPTKTAAASDGTTGLTSLKKVYDRDEQFLSSIYVFQLYCQLNRTSCQGLQARAKHTYQVLKTYLERLKVLAECLQDLEIESQIISQETDIKNLLPELGLLNTLC